MRKFIILTIIAILSITGCDTSDITNNSKKIPGKFAASLLSDTMGNNSARGISLGTYTITNSKSIFFILRNVGDFPITGITLTPGKLVNNGLFDNAINASPSAITVLETSGKATVETVIEVNINHGDIIGLIAQQYIQKADFAGTTLRITGKTRDEKGTVLDISLDLYIETLIKVASFDVMYSLDGGATFEKAEYGIADNAIAMCFLIPSNSYIAIRNNGNAIIKYRFENNSNLGFDNIIPWLTLHPNEYSNRLPQLSNKNAFKLQIDTIGIVFENNGNDDLILKAGTSQVVSKSWEHYFDSLIVISIN